MPFGPVTALYLPVAANAGASLWGTDVRKVLDTADAGLDQTTLTQHGTSGGLTTRTCDPYTTSTADSDQTLFGWAIQPSDMGSVAGAFRGFPAGNHVFNGRLDNSDSVSSRTATVTMYAYRVGPSPTRTRTLLGSASNSVSIPVSTPVSIAVTLALGEIIFAADETIQYSFEIEAIPIAISNHTVRFLTGTEAGNQIRVNTPALQTILPEEGTFTGGYDFSGSFTGEAGEGSGTFDGGYDFTGLFVGEAPGVASGSFTGGYDFTGSFTGSAPTPVPGGIIVPGGRERFTARRTPKNRRRTNGL